VLVAAVVAVVAVLSYWPVRNLLGRRQLMNAAFNPLQLVNTYGAFGTVTRSRDEVIVEGTRDEELGPSTEWQEYRFKGKPGDPSHRPPQVAPYHLRLDWLMWFLPLSPGYGDTWFPRFLERLLRGDRAILSLMRPGPFHDEPPRWVRARLFRYRFSSWSELRRGVWWSREPLGEFVPPIRLRPERDA
jgi:hypothetical protein